MLLVITVGYVLAGYYSWLYLETSSASARLSWCTSVHTWKKKALVVFSFLHICCTFCIWHQMEDTGILFFFFGTAQRMTENPQSIDCRCVCSAGRSLRWYINIWDNSEFDLSIFWHRNGLFSHNTQQLHLLKKNILITDFIIYVLRIKYMGKLDMGG